MTAKKKAKKKATKSRELLARERLWNSAIDAAAKVADDILADGRRSMTGRNILALRIRQ